MKRRKFSSAFKTKVVLEALSERYTMSELAERHQLHPNQITSWKKHFLTHAGEIFDKGSAEKEKRRVQDDRDKLLKVIGELKVENDFLKKVL